MMLSQFKHWTRDLLLYRFTFFCKISYKINFFATCFINCCNWSLVKTQSMTLVNMTCHLQRWHERQQATTGTIIKYKSLQSQEPFFHHRRPLLFTELSGVPFAACFLLHVKPFLKLRKIPVWNVNSELLATPKKCTAKMSEHRSKSGTDINFTYMKLSIVVFLLAP